MKKSTIAVIMVLMLLLVACHTSTGNNGNTQGTTGTNQTTESLTGKTNEHSSTTSTMPSTGKTATLPIYVSGNIELQDESYIQSFMGVDYPLHYRAVYYSLDARLIALVGQEKEAIWMEEYKAKYDGEEATEMMAVAFVEHFNISKEDFQKYVNDATAFLLRIEIDVTDELYELPNPDIVYTFDNELINEYYRRE